MAATGAATYDLVVHQVPILRTAQPGPPHLLSVSVHPSSPTLAEGERAELTLRARVPLDAPADALWRVVVTAAPRDAGDATPFAVGALEVRQPSTGAAPRPDGDAAPGEPLSGALFVASGVALAAGSGALALRRETWRWALLAPLAPLYSRLRRGDVLAQETRERVYALVRAHPGAYLARLEALSGLGSGALVYQLRVLERHRLVASRREGKLRRFYPTGEVPAPRDLTPHQERILDLLGAGGLTQREVAAALRLTQQGASYHLRALETKGRVELSFERDAWRYYPRAPG